LLHGLSFERAYICADGTGGVEFAGPKGEPWGAAIRALAGPCAEARYLGQPVAEMFTNGTGEVDHEHAQAALAAAGRDLPEALDITNQLIEWSWPAIVAIAAVLEAKGEIDCDEAVALVNLAMAPGEV
jgi:hypothetical protein